jgi:hypothetical protein
LASPNAARYSKKGLTHVGPVFELVDSNTGALRLRFDQVLEIHPDAAAAYEAMDRWRRERSLVLLPKKGDVAILDNRRILHGRGRVYGERARRHDRMWIASLHEDIRPKVQLGIRPIDPDIVAAIRTPHSMVG